MPAGVLQVTSTESVRRIVRRETNLRVAFMQVAAERETRPRVEGVDVRRLILDSVGLLEMFLFTACLSEITERLRIRTFGDLSDNIDEVLADLRQSLRVEDPMAIVHGYLKGAVTAPPLDRETPVSMTIDELRHHVRAIVDAWPIGRIVSNAIEIGAEHLAHRARVAHAGLRAFLLRNDPETKRVLEVAGHAYQRGGLSLDDVGALLRMDASDAIALLEQCGYCRSLQNVALDDAGRARVLQIMEEDRKKRAGVPAYSQELVVRDVIASERIEGVDAREWIRRAVTS